MSCSVEITYLDSLDSQSNNIILGGLFFQEFFGVFVNNYTDAYNVTQSAKMYVGTESLYSSYIGAEEYT